MVALLGKPSDSGRNADRGSLLQTQIPLERRFDARAASAIISGKIARVSTAARRARHAGGHRNLICGHEGAHTVLNDFANGYVGDLKNSEVATSRCGKTSSRREQSMIRFMKESNISLRYVSTRGDAIETRAQSQSAERRSALHAGSARKWPLFPPCFSSSRVGPIVIPRSTALHMS
jgi:hypothetical protein